MEISEINRIVNLLQKVDCTWYALIADVAREMGIKKTALMQFIDDNPKNFSIQEITITSAKGVKKTLGLGIRKVYLTAEQNPETEEWLAKQKADWEKKLHVYEQTYYGQHEFWCFPEEYEQDSRRYHLWRNTPEKFQELVENGILKKTTQWYGGLSDSYQRDVYLCNDDILQKLADAGWTTDFEEVLAQINSK
jgi:hypothetical protein